MTKATRVQVSCRVRGTRVFGAGRDQIGIRFFKPSRAFSITAVGILALAAFAILRLLAARFVVFPSAASAPVSAAVAAVAVIALAAAAIPAARACRGESIVLG
jgi:hypothetical protein